MDGDPVGTVGDWDGDGDGTLVGHTVGTMVGSENGAWVTALVHVCDCHT